MNYWKLKRFRQKLVDIDSIKTEPIKIGSKKIEPIKISSTEIEQIEIELIKNFDSNFNQLKLKEFKQ